MLLCCRKLEDLVDQKTAELIVLRKTLVERASGDPAAAALDGLPGGWPDAVASTPRYRLCGGSDVGWRRRWCFSAGCDCGAVAAAAGGDWWQWRGWWNFLLCSKEGRGIVLLRASPALAGKGCSGHAWLRLRRAAFCLPHLSSTSMFALNNG